MKFRKIGEVQLLPRKFRFGGPDARRSQRWCGDTQRNSCDQGDGVVLVRVIGRCSQMMEQFQMEWLAVSHFLNGCGRGSTDLPQYSPSFA